MISLLQIGQTESQVSKLSSLMQQNSQTLACPHGSKAKISLRGMSQITQLSKVNSIGFMSFKSTNVFFQNDTKIIGIGKKNF